MARHFICCVYQTRATAFAYRGVGGRARSKNLVRFAAELMFFPRGPPFSQKARTRPTPITREERRVARRTHVGFVGTALRCPRVRLTWTRNAAPRVARGEPTGEFTSKAPVASANLNGAEPAGSSQ